MGAFHCYLCKGKNCIAQGFNSTPGVQWRLLYEVGIPAEQFPCAILPEQTQPRGNCFQKWCALHFVRCRRTRDHSYFQDAKVFCATVLNDAVRTLRGCTVAYNVIALLFFQRDITRIDRAANQSTDSFLGRWLSQGDAGDDCELRWKSLTTFIPHRKCFLINARYLHSVIPREKLS